MSARSPRKPPGLNLAGALGHASSDKRFDILRHIGEGGSISEAARRAGVSYKAAWQAIETLGNLAGTPMVAKAVGGSGGGGTLLTAAGLRVLQAAAQLEVARAQVLAVLEPALPAAAGRPAPVRPGAGTHLAALALRTSLRNQFPCQVCSLANTGGRLRVGLALPGGALLHAVITRESAQLLALARGQQVLALCKATAVRVAAQIEAADGRNRLVGTVQRTSRAAAGGEVALRLSGGVSLVGFADGGHGLKVGQAAMASADESGVVIALPA